MTNYYVDGVNGNNGNDGLSEANAKQTIQAGLDLFSGGGNACYVQATGTYTITAALAMSIAGTNAAGRNWIEGYTTTPGARDGKPTITCATNGVHLFELGAEYLGLAHLKLTHTAGTRGDGIRNIASTAAERAKVEDIEIDGCQIGIDENWSLNYIALERVKIHNCISHGVSLTNNVKAFHSTFKDNGGAGFHAGFQTGFFKIGWNQIFGNTSHGVHLDGAPAFLSDSLLLFGNKIADNGGSGFKSDETSSTEYYQLLANIFWGNGAYGVDLAIASTPAAVRTKANAFNAYGSNTSGARNNLPAGFGDITLTADPFVNLAAGDLDINNTAGGGASLRAGTFTLP